MIFDTQQEVILEDRRVRLVPLKLDHLPLMQAFAKAEPQLWDFSTIRPNTEEAMENYVRKALKDRESGDSYPFAVFDKQFDAWAGSTRFYDIQIANDSLQLGYTWYGKQFQRTGLNQHCKYLLLSYAFDTLGAHRVEFRADANNERSIAAMKRIGCTVEGILRANSSSWYGRRDSIVLSILAPEWRSEVQQHLKQLIDRYA